MRALATLSYLAGVILLVLAFFPFSPMTLKFWMPRRETMLSAHRQRFMLRGLGFGGLGVTFVLAVFGFGSAAWAWMAVLTAAFFLFFWWGAYVPVIMGYPRQQQLLRAAEADAVLKPDDDVLGVVVNGEARAYSRTGITRPHLYHDTLASTPLAVTYCILCNSGVAFRSELAGRRLHLHPITAFNNNIIYHDAQTDNYVQQIEGAVIAGPQAGEQLATVSTTLATWQAWKALYPDTTVLYAPETGLRDRLLTWMLSWMIPLAGLMRRLAPWHPLKGLVDTRLPAMALVLGVEAGGTQKAYAVSLLRRERVVNDSFGKMPVAVLYDPALDTGGIFVRQVDEQVLSFRPSTDAQGKVVVVDEESGSQWDVTGKAQTGTLAGKELKPLPHFSKVFWFSWAAFRPRTELVAERSGEDAQPPQIDAAQTAHVAG
jgi:hypothetical protein